MDWSIIRNANELGIMGAQPSLYCYPFVIGNIGNSNLKADNVVSNTFSIDELETAIEYATG